MNHCIVEDCTNPSCARGLCRRHYNKHYLAGKLAYRKGKINVKTFKGRPWVIHVKTPRRIVRPRTTPKPRVFKAKKRIAWTIHHKLEYVSWASMKQRCYNPKDPRYDRYGGSIKSYSYVIVYIALARLSSWPRIRETATE